MIIRLSILLPMSLLFQRSLLSEAFSPTIPTYARRQVGRHCLLNLAASKKPENFFSPYDDEELLNVLNIHRRLTGDDSSSEDITARQDDDNGMSIHEEFLKSQGEETMQSLLDLHESLKNGETDAALQQREQLLDLTKRQNEDATTIPPSLHDLVQEAVGTVASADDDSNGGDVRETIELDDAMLKKIDNIRAIASDVDGTLVTAQNTIHPRTRQAILRALKSPKHFFPATGKSREGARNSIGVEMAALLDKHNVPGVFLQGLYCLDGKGNVIYEKKLTNDAIRAVEELAKETGVALVAYDGSKLCSTGMTEGVRELTEKYGEPPVQVLDIPLSEYENGFHKVLLIDINIERLTTEVRPKLDALAESKSASVTQAMPTMLEWLPPGCSKAKGVRKVCESLGIDPTTELLAMGDAENDVEMLKMASIGVAVGNAGPIAQEAADFFMEETNNEGGAGAAMELFGLAGCD